MNLGWVDENTEEDQIRRTILHEFGHALGAYHEHTSPYIDIQWNKDVVYQKLLDENGWDAETVDRNMFTVYPVDQSDATEFDIDSIMLYAYEASWTLDGKGAPFNTQLSEHDKTYIKFCYPSENFDAGQFSTMDIRTWEKPQPVDSKLLYYHQKYRSVPQIPVGITSLDANKGANIRIAAEASDATQERFKASLRSWADTTIYSASLTYLEVDPKRFNYLQTGVYNTTETRPWNQPQAKQSKRIEFAKPFADPPRVVTWLQALDMDRNKNWRVKVHATDVDSKGFTIHIDSWADSILYSAGATWLAYPANQPEVTSGRFSTSDIRAWNSPRAENSSTFNFPKAFSKQPKVIMAIDELDYDCQSNLRVRLSTSSVTNTGMTWHLQSWFDSKMYTSGASFFAWA
ncbi:hypothetical protein N0V92_003215 [Colletotrichum tropicale]|nr:hypothetical protein N0V92_003215 [Colletotrichum tropicale]